MHFAQSCDVVENFWIQILKANEKYYPMMCIVSYRFTTPASRTPYAGICGQLNRPKFWKGMQGSTNRFPRIGPSFRGPPRSTDNRIGTIFKKREVGIHWSLNRSVFSKGNAGRGIHTTMEKKFGSKLNGFWTSEAAKWASSQESRESS